MSEKGDDREEDTKKEKWVRHRTKQSQTGQKRSPHTTTKQEEGEKKQRVANLPGICQHWGPKPLGISLLFRSGYVSTRNVDNYIAAKETMLLIANL